MKGKLRNLIALIAVAAVLGVAIAVPVSAYSTQYQYPSYSGCTIQQYTIANGQLIYAESYDTGGCATNVAAKAFWFAYDSNWYDTGWDIDPTAAGATQQSINFQYGKGWAQIEVGSGNWGADGGAGTISSSNNLYP
jgi:hypothetical protein